LFLSSHPNSKPKEIKIFEIVRPVHFLFCRKSEGLVAFYSKKQMDLFFISEKFPLGQKSFSSPNGPDREGAHLPTHSLDSWAKAVVT
jgi:hypothetical protein